MKTLFLIAFAHMLVVCLAVVLSLFWTKDERSNLWDTEPKSGGDGTLLNKASQSRERDRAGGNRETAGLHFRKHPLDRDPGLRRGLLSKMNAKIVKKI